MKFTSIIITLVLLGIFCIPAFGQTFAQVTWNTFDEKDGLFSVQVPSNWNVSELSDDEKLAPVDYMLRYNDKGDSFAWIEILINKPSFSNSTAILESYLSEYQQFDDFSLLKPIECNAYTLNDAPACSLLSSQQLEGEQIRNVLNVVSISPDDIQTDVVFITSANIFDSFLPVGEYMINSLAINSTAVNILLENQSLENIESEIPLIPTGNDTALQSEIPVIPKENDSSQPDSNIPSKNDTMIQQETFRSVFDTFVTSDPQGFGVYDKKATNVFRPGEDMILYIEPTGFEYGTSTSDKNKKLYTINFSADFRISDTEGNELTGQEGLPVSEIVSHHQNKEVFIPFTITQTTPFPTGNYIITYTIHDTNSGKSFDIVKEVVISDNLAAPSQSESNLSTYNTKHTQQPSTNPSNINTQNSPRINWYEICMNPVVDKAISEPCSTLTTNGGYTLTPEGERVLACIGGGAVAILAGQSELLALKNQVGCGTNSQDSSSSSFPSSSGSGNDPIGDLIGSLLG
jgi:hypothetical protein